MCDAWVLWWRSRPWPSTGAHGGCRLTLLLRRPHWQGDCDQRFRAPGWRHERCPRQRHDTESMFSEIRDLVLGGAFDVVQGEPKSLGGVGRETIGSVPTASKVVSAARWRMDKLLPGSGTKKNATGQKKTETGQNEQPVVWDKKNANGRQKKQTRGTKKTTLGQNKKN